MAQYDFNDFEKVTITGIDTNQLSIEEQSVLYQQARYCQAMIDADINVLKSIISKDKIFTHMSGRQQSRDDYLRDIKTGQLNYFNIGILKPSIEVNGDYALIRFTSILNANAYGASGTFRMDGTHHYQRINGDWIAVND